MPQEIAPTATLLPELEGTYSKIVAPEESAEFSLFTVHNETEMFLHFSPEMARTTFNAVVPKLEISWDMEEKPVYIFSSDKDWRIERDEGQYRDWAEVTVLTEGGAEIYLHVKYDEDLVNQSPGSSIYYSKSLSALMVNGLLDYGVQKGIYTEEQAKERLGWYIGELSKKAEFQPIVVIVEKNYIQVNR